MSALRKEGRAVPGRASFNFQFSRAFTRGTPFPGGSSQGKSERVCTVVNSSLKTRNLETPTSLENPLATYYLVFPPLLLYFSAFFQALSSTGEESLKLAKG